MNIGEDPCTGGSSRGKRLIFMDPKRPGSAMFINDRYIWLGPTGVVPWNDNVGSVRGWSSYLVRSSCFFE